MAVHDNPLLGCDLYTLMRALVDIESVSRNERYLADCVEDYLDRCPGLITERIGNTLVARTDQGHSQRVILAGHLDTVPVADNLPSRCVNVDGRDMIYGRGSADMKGGIACMLWLASHLGQTNRDLTWIFYDCEEIEAELNGLRALIECRPDLVDGDFAVVMEPTSARIEGGCQGTMRFDIITSGVAAHSARSWLGKNAIHELRDVLERIEDFELSTIHVDGLDYREGLNATRISGGIAGNVVPDEARVHINYRFAPDKSAKEALAIMKEWFARWPMEVIDLSESARPGLDRAIAHGLIKASGKPPAPKYGWTDVARFTSLGIPAVNFGPADAGKAHAVDECCPLEDLTRCVEALTQWLTEPIGEE